MSVQSANLQGILNHGLATREEKIDCLKMFKVVLKNLADAEKTENPKFRQLRLSNEKVASKLTPCNPDATIYLQSLGFERITEGDDIFLRISNGTYLNLQHYKASYQELLNALDGIDPNKVVSPAGLSSETNVNGYREGAKRSATTAKMSEKQKARILMEEKKKREMAADKLARAKTAALIKQDKHVRENDANWKSGQSAACVKSGTGISTFRDRYGE